MRDSLIFAYTALGVVVLCVAITVISRSAAWREMDWNQDGSTSLAELFAASDIGERGVVVDGEECIEHFAYKDGLPVRTDCPSGRHVARIRGR